MKIKSLIFSLLFLLSGPLKAAFINDPAPNFTLKTLQGNDLSLTDIKGSVVFVNFWASWCPPCKKEFPELAGLAKEYKDKKFRLMAINLDKSSSRVEEFITRTGVDASAATILLDPDSKVVASYVARSMPSSFIIDEKGIIRFVHFGYSEKDPAKWRHEIDQLLSAISVQAPAATNPTASATPSVQPPPKKVSRKKLGGK